MMVRQRFRGLFQKYLLVLFMAVAIPLAINGVIEAWFGYRDQRARLDQLLGVQATSACDNLRWNKLAHAAPFYKNRNSSARGGK